MPDSLKTDRSYWEKKPDEPQHSEEVMERDIVDRMIEWLYAPEDEARTMSLITEAIDEIENLRGALDYYADRKPSPYVGTGPYDPACVDPGFIARVALGEGK